MSNTESRFAMAFIMRWDFDWIEFMDYLNWKSAHKMTGQKEQVQASVHDSSRIPDIKLGIKNKQNTCILHRFTGILL